VGTYDENLILNTVVYGAEFPDGEVGEYTVNLIVENIYFYFMKPFFHICSIFTILPRGSTSGPSG